MTNQALAAAVAVLRIAYPRQDFPDDTVRLYVRQLRDIDPAVVEEAVDRLLKTSKWIPTIAEIRETCAELCYGLPTAAEAWTLMLEQPYDAWPDTLRDTVKACGGRWHIVHSERSETARAQFIADYDSRRRIAITRGNVSGGLTRAEQSFRVLTARSGLDGPTHPGLQIPHTESMPPRPVYARWLRRQNLHVGSLTDMPGFQPPTDEEKHDAILVLAESGRGHYPVVHTLHEEAQRIMDEASAA